ncbi:tetratricopeptide repeat protein [Candidatus Nitrospira neomarina]|uniref:Tetratricopeptide repeat protein n=1 Tax=Candidatus Nitrospira neomarina TaxID=3020899 RepID=A0AA96GNM8_9BACT|nr:tetratricopeptide repeat protein [Candidatus Nitrospira neomarina]
MREQTWGSTHPEVATSLNNLGALYVNQGDYAKAESILMRALAIREHAFGPEHPNTKTVQKKL